jgi:MerR family transcriptional regulator, thiopeptide resistance regulator
MEKRQWKIGELDQESDLTIRTLHDYDQIGLLKPSRHTESGRRFYTKYSAARRKCAEIGSSMERAGRDVHR